MSHSGRNDEDDGQEEDLDESEGAGGGGPGLQNVSRALDSIAASVFVFILIGFDKY